MEGLSLKRQQGLKEEKLRQLPDKQIVEIAVKERRIIITHDRDFLTFINDPKCKAKILLISINPQTEERMEAVGKFLTRSGILNKLRRSGVVTYWTNEISFSLV